MDAISPIAVAGMRRAAGQVDRAGAELALFPAGRNPEQTVVSLVDGKNAFSANLSVFRVSSEMGRELLTLQATADD